MQTPPQIAVVATTFYPYSHADVIVSRWLAPWADDARAGFMPQTQIAGMWVEQFPALDIRDDAEILQWRETFAKPWRVRPDVDMARYTAEKYDLPLYNSIREALTLGTNELAVDGVLLIGEHGQYPFNENGQKLYPRKELWDAIVAVFDEFGRVVPVFNDKGLSWNPDWARQMFDEARAKNIALMAGSSLTMNGFAAGGMGTPPGKNCQIEESVCFFGAGPESYGFHSVEWILSELEKGAPDLTARGLGVEAIRVWEGEAVWDALDAGELPLDLFEMAALHAQTAGAAMRAKCRELAPLAPRTRLEAEWFGLPVAFTLLHSNGARTHHFFVGGAAPHFVMALRYRDEHQLSQTFAAFNFAEDEAEPFMGHFARLNAKIEQMILEGQSPVPLERTLLSTLTIAEMMSAFGRGDLNGQTRMTPHLDFDY